MTQFWEGRFKGLLDDSLGESFEDPKKTHQALSVLWGKMCEIVTFGMLSPQKYQNRN